MKLDTEKILQGNFEISSLPNIFYKVNSAVEDPETSFGEIGQIISGDVVLAARLLKIVNSSFYGFSSKIETITHAVTIVGMIQLRDLVLATTIAGQFRSITKTTLDMEAFWLHSVSTGLAARIIAHYRKESNPERYYVMGLLHDIGRLLLLLNAPDEMKLVLEHYRKGGLLYEAEYEVLGLDHAKVAGALLEKWELPVRLTDAINFHHDPENAKINPTDAAIIHVADIISHSMELGGSAENYVPPLNSAAWDRLELPSSILSSIHSQVDRQSTDAIKIFL
jgi:HD-like signal output (HDOD) protein